MLRVAAPGTDVTRQVELARRLREEGVPVVAPLVAIEGLPVSAWEYVACDGRPIDYAQLGAVAARLHRLPPVELPSCGDAAWLDVEARMPDVPALRAAAERLAGWREQARRSPQVLCHGDLHPHNVLMRGDEVVILDWDAACTGPPAWDHAALIPWAERYGGPAHAYPDFARGYGQDLREDPLARTLAEVRLLGATLNAFADPRRRAEADRRLRYWLGDPDAPAWQP